MTVAALHYLCFLLRLGFDWRNTSNSHFQTTWNSSKILHCTSYLLLPLWCLVMCSNTVLSLSWVFDIIQYLHNQIPNELVRSNVYCPDILRHQVSDLIWLLSSQFGYSIYLIVPSLVHLVAYQAGILAWICLTKMSPMGWANLPDMSPKHSKKGTVTPRHKSICYNFNLVSLLRNCGLEFRVHYFYNFL